MTKLNCLNPTPAYIVPSVDKYGIRRDKIFLFRERDYRERRNPDTLIPCRKCKACKLSERNKWIGRIKQEAIKTKPQYFITLTYAENPIKLIYKDIQKFFKRLRKKHDEKIKYLVAGEYGERNRRPHWHILTFGLKINDLKFFKLSSNGAYYLSKEIANTWKNGYILISEFSEAVANYVAGYTLKKYEEEIIFKCSKGFGMGEDEIRLLETFTRGNGSGITQYEKQKLRKKYGNTYYKYADKIRAEAKIKKEKFYELKNRKKEISKIYGKITKKLGLKSLQK